jgi:hypothetical protein
MECWSTGFRANSLLHYSTIPSSLDGQRLIESRLAAIRSIFVNDPALGSFIDSGDQCADLLRTRRLHGAHCLLHRSQMRHDAAIA